MYSTRRFSLCAFVCVYLSALISETRYLAQQPPRRQCVRWRTQLPVEDRRVWGCTCTQGDHSRGNIGIVRGRQCVHGCVCTYLCLCKNTVFVLDRIVTTLSCTHVKGLSIVDCTRVILGGLYVGCSSVFRCVKAVTKSKTCERRTPINFSIHAQNSSFFLWDIGPTCFFSSVVLKVCCSNPPLPCHSSRGQEGGNCLVITK